MKELSIEQKAKAYDEALERARAKYAMKDQPIHQDLVDIFPELAESKDERICKQLIAFLKQCKAVYGDNFTQFGLNIDDAIAWLEKRAEQKHQYNSRPKYIGEEELLGEQKPADKVETKFHEGDWVILTAGELSTTLQIVKVDTNKKLYWFNDSSYLPIVDEECLHFWSIQDAKAGDVVVDTSDGTIGIYQSLGSHPDGGYNNDDSYCLLYCRFEEDGFFYADFEHGNEMETSWYILPATKEQRELLFQKMHEAGYEWDAEKKELIKVEQKLAAWSEEDEKQARQIERIVSNDGCTKKLQKQIADWFKSLKERIQPQSHWKPSKEQLHILESVIADYDNQGLSYTKDMLCDLYEQLKKL